jgi:hypothetical protein
MSLRVRSLAPLSLLAAAVVACATPARAQQEQGATPAAPSEAEVLLLKMADTLGQADAFSVHIRTGYDAVQASGQKIEFVESRDVLVSRPDKLRIETKSSTGEKGLVVFDGKTISVATAADNVYAQAEKPGSLDDAIRYFRRDLRMRLPLAAMLLTTLRDELESRLVSADLVETAAMCDGKYSHVAAIGDEVDLQVWIATKGPALPKRLVLTYKHAEGQPQFWAEFSDWDLSPWVSSSKFRFKAPEGARKIAFLPQLQAVTPAAAR